MNIIPISLGIAVENESKNPDFLKGGLEMRVIVKRGTLLPYSASKIFTTVVDYQKVAKFKIYEGEKKYVKYNHFLREFCIMNIPPKFKGEVKIKVKFFIDVNGILRVTAAILSEEGKELETTEAQIEYLSIRLNNEKIEKLKNRNKIYYKRIKNPILKFELSSARELLIECEEALKETIDEEDKYYILMIYIDILEEFINSFEQNNYDNEIMLEKLYIYIKHLFESYTKVLNIIQNFESNQENKNQIKNNIMNYLKIFTLKSSGYLNDLLDILEKCPRKFFYEIIIFTMEQKNINGKKCLEERKQFCRYNSLIFFETAYSLYNQYITNFNKIAMCSKDIREKCKEQLKLCLIYINEIKTGSILLLEDSIRQGKLIKSSNTGFTRNLIGLKLGNKEEKEKIEIVLQNYEKLLREINPNIELAPRKSIISPEISFKEAICFANIVKISYLFLGKTNRRLIKLCERCEFLAAQLNISENNEWYKEFCEIYKEFKDTFEMIIFKNKINKFLITIFFIKFIF